MALAVRLKKLRAGREESLQAVADAVGVSKAHIWELETGRAGNPSLDLLTRLAAHFDTSVSSLVGESPGDEGPDLIAMFRDLKALTKKDRETIRAVMITLKKQGKK